MPDQLTLRVGQSDSASFENYLLGTNAEAVAAINQFASDGAGLFFVFGDGGAGKTHLLYAAQKLAASCQRRSTYLSLADPDVVRNLAGLVDHGDLACVDDLDAAAGDIRLERFLFNMIEQQKLTNGGVLLAARNAVNVLGFVLPDLKSRLASGVTYRLNVLDDDSKRRAMQLRARHRGFDLPDDVISYVMRRYPRDLSALFGLLDRIDEESLSAQRKVTIPWIKQLDRQRKEQEVS